MITRPIDDVTASNYTSEVITLNKIAGKDELTVQISITASATVSVQGRLSSDADWFELVSIVANAIQPLALITQLRFVLTGNNGVVNAFVRS